MFTQEDVRTNVLLNFKVGQDFDRLAIHLRYGPKIISDPGVVFPQIAECEAAYLPSGWKLAKEDAARFCQLKNLVTLSVDKNGTYIGCAHRQSPEQIILLSERTSSDGFLPVAASAGAWRLVLHVHAVIVGTVGYQAAVYGLEEGEGDDTIPAF